MVERLKKRHPKTPQNETDLKVISETSNNIITNIPLGLKSNHKDHTIKNTCFKPTSNKKNLFTYLQWLHHFILNTIILNVKSFLGHKKVLYLDLSCERNSEHNIIIQITHSTIVE